MGKFITRKISGMSSSARLTLSLTIALLLCVAAITGRLVFDAHGAGTTGKAYVVSLDTGTTTGAPLYSITTGTQFRLYVKVIDQNTGAGITGITSGSATLNAVKNVSTNTTLTSGTNYTLGTWTEVGGGLYYWPITISSNVSNGNIVEFQVRVPNGTASSTIDAARFTQSHYVKVGTAGAAGDARYVEIQPSTYGDLTNTGSFSYPFKIKFIDATGAPYNPGTITWSLSRYRDNAGATPSGTWSVSGTWNATESCYNMTLTVSGTTLTTGNRYYIVILGTSGNYSFYQSFGLTAVASQNNTPLVNPQFTSPELLASPPTVSSPTATAIGTTAATLGATVTSNGGSTLTARGTVWGTTAAPTGNALAEGGTAVGTFTHNRTGLPAGTRIYYRGYATNSSGTAYSPDGSFYTEPATQASAVTFSGVTANSMTVNWTRGSGTGVIVLMSQGSSVSADPVDGTYTAYTPSTTFGSGTQIGTGNYVVYKGTGTSVTVTGLTAGATYYAAVYEYAGAADTTGADQGTNYKATPATGNQATASACIRQAPTVSFTVPGSVAPGGTKVYTVTVTNNDTAACSPSTFTLSVPSETGNTASFNLPSVLGSTTTGSLAPLASYNTTLTVSAKGTATVGQTLTSTVSAADATNHPSQSGSGQITTTVSNIFVSHLMHNAANLGSSYSGGTWGEGKDCTWCHSDSTTNIKRIAQQIDVPWTAGTRPVIFQKITSSSLTYMGAMGTDQRSDRSVSTNICEVCHTQTKYHQYSANSVTTPQLGFDHNNNKDCTLCHKHSSGFKGDGHSFPYQGAIHMAEAGTSPWPSCNSCHNTSSAAAKTYPVPAGTPPNCVACHINGLLTPVGTSSCYDCHGATATDAWPNGTAFPNTQGSHTLHRNGVTGISCSYCHNGAGTGTPNHGYANRTVTTQADILFSPQAGASASWDQGAHTCSTTLCHGATSPQWGSNTSNALCTKCHGTPSTSDTNANRAPNVGAHQVHVRGTGSYGYSRELTCWECHNSSTDGTVNFTNHMNGDTQNVTFANASTARDNGVSATWTPGTYPNGTCSVYCHGASMPRGDASGTQRTPAWTANLMTGTASNDCSLCHGNPPSNGTTAGIHAGQTPTTSCTNCHTHFTSAGGFSSEANRRLHVDGILQVKDDCDTCHDYDTVGATYSGGVWSGGYWGRAPKSTPDGFGAHAKHINYIKTRLGYTAALNAVAQTYGAAGSDNLKVCGTCHATTAAAHTVDNSSGRSIYPAGHPYLMGGTGGTSLLFGSSNPSYDAGTRTCSNISCHYFTTPAW